MLTREEILLILARLADTTVLEPTERFPYRISQTKRGYSDDEQIGKLQAKLSIMLEMTARHKET